MLQACVCKEVSWTPEGSETAAAYISCFNAQSTISFSPYPSCYSFSSSPPSLPLSHLLWGLAMAISVTAVESLEKVGPWWEIAWPVLHLRWLHRRVQ